MNLAYFFYVFNVIDFNSINDFVITLENNLMENGFIKLFLSFYILFIVFYFQNMYSLVFPRCILNENKISKLNFHTKN